MRLALLAALMAVAALVAVVVPMVTRSAPPVETFASATAYLRTPAPHPKRAIKVKSVRGFYRAIGRARAGQTIDVLGNVQIPGEFKGFSRVIRGGTVNVVFEKGAGFIGGPTPLAPAVWIRNAGGWRIWGGTITNQQGKGILVSEMPGPLVWTGFTVSRTGDQCVAVYPSEGDINGITLAGVAGTAIPDLDFDPHGEKGTGLHAWNIADAAGGIVENSTFAADTVNQATGAAVQIETDRIGPNVKVFARARHVGFAVPNTSWMGDATLQVAGNVVQLWGGSLPGSLDIAYVEGNDIQGRLLAVSIDDGADLSRVTVDFGRATGPILLNPRLSRVAYQTAGGLHLRNVRPLGKR